MASTDPPRSPHALVVPALPAGHTIACLRLARALLAAGFHVSFLHFSSKLPTATQEKFASSQDKYMPLADDAGIRTYVIADSIPPEHVDKPFFDTPAMTDNLLSLLLHLREQSHPPTCLISDSFVPWTARVAKRVGIPRIEFWTSNALSYLLNLNVPALCKENIFPERALAKERGNRMPFPPVWKSESSLMLDCIPCLRPIPSELFPAPIRFEKGPHPFLALLQEVCSCVELSERLLIYSLSELEPDAFRGLQAMGLRAYAVGGPLFLQGTTKTEIGKDVQHHKPGAARETDEVKPSSTQSSVKENVDCLQWLDTQAEASVIYVAFGTVVSLFAEDVEELAMGLEACGNPFLWAMREDSRGGIKAGRRGKGMVTNWAPQVKVLAHKAIGGFLTHCGWNSTVESMWEGVPMLGCPQLGDQTSNMWCVCELWGTGLELQRANRGGLRRAYVEAGVKALLEGEEGRRARKRAGEMKKVMREACQQESGESFTNLLWLYEDMKAKSS
ncbi:hypothetical protein L7F22_024962 [Adiantum nelumboides]|nr:hypothetical protein [Adiantum nelumboides]